MSNQTWVYGPCVASPPLSLGGQLQHTHAPFCFAGFLVSRLPASLSPLRRDVCATASLSLLRRAVCATGIFACTRYAARVLNAVKYPLCPMTTLNLVQTEAKERGLPGIVLHQRPNAIILGTSMSSSRLPVEGVTSLPIA